MIKHFFNKLSIQISAIIILFGALGMTVFCFLYSYREDFFEFSQKMGIISENTEAYAINIENQLIDNNVSINDVDTIDSILGISEIYSVNLYNKANNLSITGSYATMLDNLLVGYTVYDTDAIYNGDIYHTDIELEDGTIEMYVYSYAIAKMVVPYLVFSIIIALLIFLIPTFLFIKRKVHHIENLKNDVTYLSQGDLNHPISINSNDEIGELSHQINNLRLILKDNFATEEANRKANYDLVTALSHDLRTPLTSILGSSSTILENDDVIDKETRVELLKNIYEDTSWLTHSVENILSMTRIDEGKLDIEKRPEVVDEIIAESILRVKKFANSRDIKTNIPDEIIIVHVDVLLIEQVLVNLIDNAIRHTPKNSKIELTVKKESNQVLFEVADNGKGIPNEDIGNIFNRFYTKNKSRNLERRGIGLGLEICKSIVEAHGGEIVAFNNPSGGATFRFSIPMYDEEGKDKWK